MRTVPILGTVRARAIVLAATVGAVAGCTLLLPESLETYGEPPSDCRGFVPGAGLAWAGHGHPEDFGLIEPDIEHEGVRGDIFVEAVRSDADGGAAQRQFCVLVPSRENPSAVYGFGVPEGWVPPP